MALEICSIASGSNGNCYYIGNETDAILVDVGISCREVERRMARQGLEMQRIKGIFVSHEHTDHIRGVTVLANKYQLPVFMTRGTRNACKLAIPDRLLNPLTDLHCVSIGKLGITGFHKYHDAAEPHSFIIRDHEVSVGVFTDIGRVCDRLVNFFSECHAVFLEANYDEGMLANGRYPYFLKNRIRSGFGHLSNAEALSLFLHHRTDRLSHLFLAHLSKDNNDPTLVENLFNAQRGQSQIVLAGRFSETEVYRIASTEVEVCERETAAIGA